MMSIKGINLPEYIKQHGYIAQKKTDYYAVEYMSGGHIPSEDYVELSIDERTGITKSFRKE